MRMAGKSDLVIEERSLFYLCKEESAKLFGGFVRGIIMGSVKLPLSRAA